MKPWLLSLLVNNHFGVLTRVTGLFSRRGYNIVSLSVGETHQPGLSRITIQTCTDAPGIGQMIKQLEKLEDVKKVALLPGAETIARELVLVKLIAPAGRREKLSEALAGFGCQTAYEDERVAVLSLTDTPGQCGAFLEALSGYTILETCRTGTTALSTVGS